jgi:TetR/AcrR family transcriptional regulator, repressor for neighboring sulfatase
MAIDAGAGPEVGLGGGLRPEEREQVLAAATDLFAREGPPRSTLRWVALVSDVPVELVSSEWPTIDAILVDVLDRLSRQMTGLEGDVSPPAELLGEGAAVDLYQRIVARCLLDGLNPAALLKDFPHGDQWATILQEQIGLDEVTARQRLSQIVALAWGWRLFGPHLRIACGLPDEPDEALTLELHKLVATIVNLPPN